MDYPRFLRNISLFFGAGVITLVALAYLFESTTEPFPRSLFVVFGVFVAREWILLHPRRFKAFERFSIGLSLTTPLSFLGYAISPASSSDWIAAIATSLIFASLVALVVRQPVLSRTDRSS